ncbi:MAG: 50S ribosomal protein L4 [Gammaproteobacteria bacterium]|nr:MAG: 50S ribosomal protein L4 [Gammaproteobacteria bacterium]
MELKTQTGNAVSLSDASFARDFNEDLVHQVVNAYMSGARAGTKSLKTRSEVRGGGIKPWRQKGTGRARAGTSRSPIWRSGGATFAAKPRNYSQKINRKQYRAAMQCILSELVRQDRLILVDEFSVDVPKTKSVIEKLQSLSINNALIVSGEVDRNLYLSVRNVPHIGICDVEALDPVSLIGFEKVIMTTDAAQKVVEWLE